MSDAGTYRIRRATTDDLEQLIVVWKAAALPAGELEKRFTEFQVAEDAAGSIVAAIALKVAGADGLIHSETYADFALCDTLRPLFWDRLGRMAQSHGLYRLWTTESAPFWKHAAGFASAPGQPPEIFGEAGGPWLALRLKEEGADPNVLEAQFNQFRETERAKREKMLQKAAVLKTVGTLIAALLFTMAMGALIWLAHKQGHL